MKHIQYRAESLRCRDPEFKHCERQSLQRLRVACLNERTSVQHYEAAEDLEIRDMLLRQSLFHHNLFERLDKEWQFEKKSAINLHIGVRTSVLAVSRQLAESKSAPQSFRCLRMYCTLLPPLASVAEQANVFLPLG